MTKGGIINTHIRASFALVAMVAVFLFPHNTYAQTTGHERIQSFGSDITVHEDGVVTVKESIDYYFPEQRHGIFRDIPTSYKDEDGVSYVIPIEVMGVYTEDGDSWQYKVSKENFGTRIKIGDPDSYVSGSKTYVIHYNVHGGLRYFDDHDELYWNVTGNSWDVPIERVSAAVTLPGGIQKVDVRNTCYTGAQGSTKRNCLINMQGNSPHFAAQDPLTIVVGWPVGHVAKLLPKQPNPFFGMWPLMTPILAFIFLYRRWQTQGRDGGEQSIVVQYNPPDNMLPADVGVLIDEKANLHDISATIVDLAVRGYINIVETETKGLFKTKTGYSFTCVKDPAPRDLKDYETTILVSLFGGGKKAGKITSMADIKKNHMFHKDLASIKEDLYRETVKLGLFAKNPEKVRGKYHAYGVIFFILLGVGLSLGPIWMSAATMLWFSLSMGVTGLLFIAFAPLMPKRTPRGVQAADYADGFKMYLETAEKYRLQWQEDIGLFEKFLPYAMVFEVADKYTEAFASMDVPPPTWYRGSAFSNGQFNGALFSANLSSMSKSLNSAIMSAPSSSGSGSGFSSGGFSGGGFGGGGGGSW